MRRLKKCFIWAAVVLFIFTLAGFFILPPVAKSVLINKLSSSLRRPVAIQEVKINPYRLTLTFRGFEIKELSGPDRFLYFDELYINADVASIIKRALIITEIKLTKPYFRIVRNADATYNFLDLIKPGEGKKKSWKEAISFHFSLNNIRIEQGSVDFLDWPKHTRHTVRDILIAVPFISNMTERIDIFTKPVISATINGNRYEIQGRTKPFSNTMETVFNIDFKNLDIPYYMAYSPVDLNFKLSSGKLDTKINLAFSQSGKKPFFEIAGDIVLKDIAIDDKKGHSLIRFPQLDISMSSIDPLAPSLKFSKIALASPEVAVKRGKRGELNLLTLIPLSKEKKIEKKPDVEKEKASEPVLVSVSDFEIKEGKIAFRDEQPYQPIILALSGINLQIKNISTVKNSKADLNLFGILGKKGAFSATGPLGFYPLATELAVKIDGIDIRTFQEYFTDKLKINVTNGRISAAGNVILNDLDVNGLSATYKGKLSVSNFSSIDKLNADDLLKWKSLFFNDVRVGSNPLAIDIRQITLSDFYARLIINEDGTLNLENIVENKKSGGKNVPSTAEMKSFDKMQVKATISAKGKDKAIKIGTITMKGGTIAFLDRNIRPNYSTSLSKIVGRVSGLSSMAEKSAEVELKGKLEDHMPLELTGSIHPFKEDLFADLKIFLKDMDLSPISPYSGKYIGRTIQKGKLSLDLRYLIDKKKLDSENKIFIDQLTLGDKVESPDATKLPVGLAIALLKDMKGEINLDVPVTGHTDDPKFRLFPLIIKVFVNIVTKAATSPFALLGSVFGGGEELSYVEFDYGSTVLTGSNLEKIKTVTKMLSERPSLKIDIEGHADLENDGEGLKRFLIERKIKARKVNDMVRKGQPVISVDEIKIDPQERERYLTQVYKAEPFPKPRNVIGLIKTLPAEEMEQLLLTHTSVKENDLKLLAAERARAVRDLLLKSGQIQPERVFIVEPKNLAPDKKEKTKDSRADFRLK